MVDFKSLLLQVILCYCCLNKILISSFCYWTFAINVFGFNFVEILMHNLIIFNIYK